MRTLRKGKNLGTIARIFAPPLVVLAVSLLVWRWQARASRGLSGGDGRTTYVNGEFHFEIQVPEGWEVVEAVPRDSNATGTVLETDVLYPPELCKVTFRERDYDLWPGELRISVLLVPSGITLEDWASGYTVEAVDSVDLIQEAIDTTLDERPAVRFSIFGFDHEEIEIAAMWGGRLYAVEFAGANPNDPNVESHRTLYRELVSTFHFIGDPDD